MVLTAAKAGEWHDLGDGRVDVAGHTLGEGEFELALQPVEGTAEAVVAGSRSIVALDLVLTPELEAEGRTRDLIRVVQQARKDRDLDVTARIALRLVLSDQLAISVREHEAQLRHAVLATSVDYVTSDMTDDTSADELDSSYITFDFDVVS